MKMSIHENNSNMGKSMTKKPYFGNVWLTGQKLLKSLRTMTIPSNRFKIFFFSNVMGCHKRCDSQSKCAECARKLLAVIQHFHANHSESDLLFDGNINDEVSMEYVRIIRALLDLVFDEKIPPNIHCCKDMDGNPKNMYVISERYFSVHKCNVLALMIVEEAVLQFQDSVKHDVFFSMNSSSVEASTLETLERLIDEVKSSKYSSKTNSDVLDEKLRIYTLKFTGQGMQYLSELSKARKSFDS